MLNSRQKALLVLEDGTVFQGYAVGAPGTTVGEVVFNTAMTGYQEIITDPSYAKQIVTLTYPHIGNTGVNHEDSEANKVYASGLIVRDVPDVASNWRRTQDLSQFLWRNKIIAIAGIDTRKLTNILRRKGAQNGCITTVENEATALQLAQKFPGLKGMDLAQEVTTDRLYKWRFSTAWGESHNESIGVTEFKYHVVVYDFGVKQAILRYLVDKGCRVTVVPAKTSAADVFKLKPDGVVLSNGPGDPEPCDYAIAATKEFLAAKMPILGICLGFQILGLAHGAKTIKMKFGHHGANHPIQDLKTKEVLITSQNHGFAVDKNSLPKTLEATHVSLFDGSLQGMNSLVAPAIGRQGHPEASPGPHEANNVFDDFIGLIDSSSEQPAKTAATKVGVVE